MCCFLQFRWKQTATNKFLFCKYFSSEAYFSLLIVNFMLPFLPSSIQIHLFSKYLLSIHYVLGIFHVLQLMDKNAQIQIVIGGYF